MNPEHSTNSPQEGSEALEGSPQEEGSQEQNQTSSSGSSRNTSHSTSSASVNTSHNTTSSSSHNSLSSSNISHNSSSTNSTQASSGHSTSSIETSSSLSYSSGMDTVAITQELPDTLPLGSDDEPEHSEAWGRLFPMKTPPFIKQYLLKDEYTCGRETGCDISLKTEFHEQTYFFQTYSKVHFKIIRKQTSTGVHVFLEDNSSNGTFINGEKVGKGLQQVLMQFDEIALAHKKNKAYIYQNLSEKEEVGLPKELTDRYLVTKVLGKGAYGEVRLAFEKGVANPGKVAVKIIPNKKLTMGGKNLVDGSSDVMREVEIMKQVNHPCIVKVLDVIESDELAKTYVLLELVEGGELFDRVISSGCFKEPVAKLMFYQMLLAVQHLHDNGITHRDIKPENILLQSPDKDETLIKVTDFGVSKLIDAQTMMKTLCGTPNYLAPEVLLSQGMGQYDNKVDCWSLGVVLFICLCGYPPFTSDRQDMSLEKQITSGKVLFAREYWEEISKDAVDLVRKLLSVDPKKRLSVTQALEHAWLQDEEMQTKARQLMYPQGQFTVPLPKKRKYERTESSEAHAPPTKASVQSPPGPSSPKKPLSPVKPKPKAGSPSKRK